MTLLRFMDQVRGRRAGRPALRRAPDATRFDDHLQRKRASASPYIIRVEEADAFADALAEGARDFLCDGRTRSANISQSDDFTEAWAEPQKSALSQAELDRPDRQAGRRR